MTDKARDLRETVLPNVVIRRAVAGSHPRVRLDRDWQRSFFHLRNEYSRSCIQKSPLSFPPLAKGGKRAARGDLYESAALYVILY